MKTTAAGRVAQEKPCLKIPSAGMGAREGSCLKISGAGRNLPDEPPLKILGAGITGLSIAYHLEKTGFKNFEVFEKDAEPGGLCRTRNRDGFLIDYAVHTIFTSNPYVNSLYEEFLGENMIRRKSIAKIFFEGRYIDYPFQASLHSVSKGVQEECLRGIIEARKNGGKAKKPANFAEWLISVFGRGIAENFLIPYNEKKFGMKAEEMDIGFISWRCPEVSVEEVRASIRGSLGKDFGYNPRMRYPGSGGFDCLVKAFTARISRPIRTLHEAREIDIRNKTITFSGGKKVPYKTIVSTIPLPELVSVVKGAPPEMVSLSKKLLNQPVWVYSFGLNRKPKQPFYWAYYYGPDISFVRLSIPSAFSGRVAPKGMHLLQVECSAEFSFERVISDMAKAGVIESADDVCLKDKITLGYAYAKVKVGHPEIAEKIRAWLSGNGIHTAGRFGAWRYLNADECIQAGKDFAESFLSSAKP